uniref:Uncharacterized protein n=1 Tax=Anopheles merus TaxID=30066 RepID=A0A182VD32_ANOME
MAYLRLGPCPIVDCARNGRRSCLVSTAVRVCSMRAHSTTITLLSRNRPQSRRTLGVLFGGTAFIEKGSVRKPSVAVKINATSSAVGIQLYCVSATGNTAHAASPNIQQAIPNPENRAGGRRPNLSEMNDISTVVTTRVSPTSTALKNGSIATPASTEKLAAYTIMTKMPENC